MKYKILFEGVENENEEDLFKDMKADYLQGYKYSTPIPIDKLRNFFNLTIEMRRRREWMYSNWFHKYF